jgi:hypothetical protein
MEDQIINLGYSLSGLFSWRMAPPMARISSSLRFIE